MSYLAGVADNAAVTIVVAAVAVSAAIYYYATRTFGKWRESNVPCPRPVPLFGNTFKMALTLEHQSDTLDRIYRRFADRRVCGYYQMTTPVLMVRDPELAHAIMIKDFAHFTDHGTDVDPSVNLLARSLFFANGRRWKAMRQKLSPGFTSGKLKDTYGQIKECSDRLARAIAAGSGRVEVKEAVGGFATDVIGTCAFGLTLDKNADADSDFRTNVQKLFGSDSRLQKMKMMMGLVFPKLSKMLKVPVFSLDATDFFRSVFSDVISHRAKNNLVRNDLAQTLMHARQELVLKDDLREDDKFCDMDIIANAIFMFMAGADPVSLALSLCLYELAVNKDVQDMLRTEINSTKKNHGGALNNDFLSDLQYAEMVMNETLRKYSSVITIMRKATKDYSVPGESLLIKKGQHVIIPMYSIHNDPKYYPDPETFDPERFSAEEKSKRPNGTFFPFGDGPRQCIAKRFAEMEIKLVLSEILPKFEIRPSEKTEIPLVMQIAPGLMKPKNGVWLIFKPISD